MTSVWCEVRARGGFRVRARVRGRVGLGLVIGLWIHEKNKCTTPVSSYRILPKRSSYLDRPINHVLCKTCYYHRNFVFITHVLAE